MLALGEPKENLNLPLNYLHKQTNDFIESAITKLFEINNSN